MSEIKTNTILHTSFAGLDLDNPLMPASGPLVGSARKIKSVAKLGVGAMVTKTVSTKLPEVPRPCITAKQNYLLNAELWSEYSLEKWRDEILPEVRADLRTPLIVSAGYTRSDLEKVVPELDPLADAFEFSTHYVGTDLAEISETVAAVRSLTDKPLFMKISPHMSDPVAFTKAVLNAGANGIVAMNSLGPTLTVDLATRSVPMGNAQGEAWMSGPAIKPLALALISKIKRAVPDCIILGVGGIASADDVLEFLLAGASAVQMLSAAMMRGLSLYQKIVDDLPQALKRYGFSSIQEVIDSTLSIPKVSYEPVYPKIEHESCISCMKCVNNCPYLALSYENKVLVDEASCFGCGLCKSLCPKDAITIERSLV